MRRFMFFGQAPGACPKNLTSGIPVPFIPTQGMNVLSAQADMWAISIGLNGYRVL